VETTTKRTKVDKEIKICFPSHVFIKSLESVENFIRDIQVFLSANKESYYFLYYGENKKDIAMHERERLYIEKLMNAEF